MPPKKKLVTINATTTVCWTVGLKIMQFQFHNHVVENHNEAPSLKGIFDHKLYDLATLTLDIIYGKKYLKHPKINCMQTNPRMYMDISKSVRA